MKNVTAVLSKLIAVAFFSFLFSFSINHRVYASINTNLVSWWDFNDELCSNTITDRVDGNNLTCVNSPTLLNGFYKESGITSSVEALKSYFVTSNSPAIITNDSDWTFSTWIKISNPSSLTQQAIITRWLSPSTRQFQVYWVSATNYINFCVSDDGTTNRTCVGTPAGSVLTANWYLITFWHDSVNNTINIKVNNQPTNTANHTLGVYNNTQAIFFGERANTLPSDIWFDNIGFWSRVLTSEELKQLYANKGGYQYQQPLCLTDSECLQQSTTHLLNIDGYLLLFTVATTVYFIFSIMEKVFTIALSRS